MAKLELKNLQKKYTNKVIPVKNINLTVEAGEFLTLLGPSGCGKSTLLRLIAGLEQPTQGQVIIGGENVNNIPPGKRNIAMVFQSYALYPHLTVAENIGTSLKLRKIDPEEIKVRVQQVAMTLNLHNLLQRKPAKLSGGQRQRVALARALVREPAVFLLDEPLSNLDALLREQVRAELKQLFDSQNKPVVYVTHDQTEAMTLSTKVAVLYDGVVQQLDAPAKIYTHPANQFVAGFVGSPQMNLLTLICEKQTARLGNTDIPLPQLEDQPPHLVVGIRPEDLYLASATDSIRFPGKVILVENLGKENLLTIQLSNTDKTLRALFPLSHPQRQAEIQLAVKPESLHLFDVETGKRLF